MSNLWACHCSWCSRGIFGVSAASIKIFPFSFLVLCIWCLSHIFIVSLSRCLAIWFTLSKYHLLVWLLFSVFKISYCIWFTIFCNFCCIANDPVILVSTFSFLCCFLKHSLLIPSQIHMTNFLLFALDFVFIVYILIVLGGSSGCLAKNFPVITALEASHRF